MLYGYNKANPFGSTGDNSSQFSEPSNGSTAEYPTITESNVNNNRKTRTTTTSSNTKKNTTFSTRSSTKSYWKKNDMVLRRTVELIGTLLQKISIANDHILLLLAENNNDNDMYNNNDNDNDNDDDEYNKLSSSREFVSATEEIRRNYLQLMSISKPSICALHNAFQPQKNVVTKTTRTMVNPPPSLSSLPPILQQRTNFVVEKTQQQQQQQQQQQYQQQQQQQQQHRH